MCWSVRSIRPPCSSEEGYGQQAYNSRVRAGCIDLSWASFKKIVETYKVSVRRHFSRGVAQGRIRRRFVQSKKKKNR